MAMALPQLDTDIWLRILAHLVRWKPDARGRRHYERAEKQGDLVTVLRVNKTLFVEAGKILYQSVRIVNNFPNFLLGINGDSEASVADGHLLCTRHFKLLLLRQVQHIAVQYDCTEVEDQADADVSGAIREGHRHAHRILTGLETPEDLVPRLTTLSIQAGQIFDDSSRATREVPEEATIRFAIQSIIRVLNHDRVQAICVSRPSTLGCTDIIGLSIEQSLVARSSSSGIRATLIKHRHQLSDGSLRPGLTTRQYIYQSWDTERPAHLLPYTPRVVLRGIISHLQRYRDPDAARPMSDGLQGTTVEFLGPREPTPQELDSFAARSNRFFVASAGDWTNADVAELRKGGMDHYYSEIRTGLRAHLDEMEKASPGKGWGGLTVIVEPCSERRACPCCGAVE